MLKRKSNWVFLTINIIVCLLFFLLFAPNHQFMHLINVFFYIGYSYLMISILLFIISKRFFDGITYSFRRVINKVSKNRDYLDEWEEEPLPSEKVSRSFLSLLFFQGASLTLIMIVMLFIFYI
ncbi:DUF3899 domain-containing protein [Aquibacillus koreensis]|uniref:DUF3899 domain-containing protein n=1 Tax=Aquibacillus koreensis TaxID=279446 RepID=A0A9X4AHF4_9BACI|nr:DUF3899 domain-containing protein [Aquibacillus koreensis]MCT2535648.1 DUF3899 domain-containing protein [Aquibacillus koreensis]MDC3420067.1 DUF3899 domain-containing protein [Aquibacillus koreensis]